MSFREKNAWIALGTTLLVWGYYFFEVWRAWQAQALDGQIMLTRLLVCLAFTFVLMIGLNLLATRHRLRDFGAAPDELERQIDMGATLVAHRLRSLLLVVLAAACPWLGGLIGPAFPADPAGATAIFIANAILFALILSELVIEVVHIVRFRMIA